MRQTLSSAVPIKKLWVSRIVWVSMNPTSVSQCPICITLWTGLSYSLPSSTWYHQGWMRMFTSPIPAPKTEFQMRLNGWKPCCSPKKTLCISLASLMTPTSALCFPWRVLTGLKTLRVWQKPLARARSCKKGATWFWSPVSCALRNQRTARKKMKLSSFTGLLTNITCTVRFAG